MGFGEALKLLWRRTVLAGRELGHAAVVKYDAPLNP